MGKGLTIEEIADHENVSPARVQDSIDRCREYRYYNSNEMVGLRSNEIVLKQMDAIDGVFTQGLLADKYLPQRNGRFKKVPDHLIRLKTVETIKSMQEMAQPKAPLIQNNNQFNNNMAGGAGGFAPGMSFESRLRKIREQKGLSNDEGNVIEDAAEADTDQSVEDELADIGVDLDEEEGAEVE